MNMSFATYCALFLIPGWRDVLDLPIPERMAQLRDPEVRRRLDEQAHSEDAGVLRRLAGWGRYTIGDTFSPANDGLQGRTVADIAAERGSAPFDTLLDIVLADDLRTVLWPSPTDDDPASWDLRARVWQDERVLIGGSDAGAHLDRMCGAPYPTAFLADCLRGRQLLPVEQAVRLMTSAPADLFGLRDRGAGLRPERMPTWCSSIPTRSAPARSSRLRDLPGDSARLVAAAEGIPHVLRQRRGDDRRRCRDRRSPGRDHALRAGYRHRRRGHDSVTTPRFHRSDSPRGSDIHPFGGCDSYPRTDRSDKGELSMLALSTMGLTAQAIFYSVAVVAFVLAALGQAVFGEKISLVGVGLAAFVFVFAWNAWALS